jgi:hypothetical protein
VSRTVKACVVFGGLFAFAALAWMMFLPFFVARELKAVTGFDVKVEVLTANPFTGNVAVQGLVVANPSDYPVPDFIEVRSLYADVSEFSCLFSDSYVVNDLDLWVTKVELVQRAAGKSNTGDFIGAFSHAPAGSREGGQAAPPRPAKYLVRKLRLRVDRLIVADYSGSTKQEKTYSLGIDHTYTDISDPKQLLVPDVVRSLYPFGAHRDVVRFIPGEFGEALGGLLGSSAKVTSKLKDAGQKAGDYVKGLFDKLEQSAKP